MKKQDYTATIGAKISAREAVNAINNVAGWWTEDIEGSAERLNDVFTVRFGETFVTFKVVEVIPKEKISWLVTDCYLAWLKDKTEWKDTKLLFEISAENDETKIIFTHIGLQPDIECYESCVKGWDQYIKDSLFKLLTEGKGSPQRRKAATA